MSKIRVMDEILANKIAAGEVVERVVSIVKELVENSIDAKSDEIKVELIESGLREIKIVDNGVGMDSNDAHMAFLRHATSKLYTDDDLFNISSLGFRGEALPSIASISDVELKTCQAGSASGTYIHIKGGKIIEEGISDSRIGTSFKITDLFYNTPARLKHLSSSYAELANVIDYLNKMALSYPKVKFRLYNDGKEIINTDGTGNILKVIRNIYGLDVAKKMIEIDAKNDDYSIKGYISLPEVSRASKNYMTTIVNGRVVKNATLYRTINEAYSNYKEDKRYPICVFLIDTDPSLLDVNIHPSKLDIRFSNFDELNNLITETIIKNLRNKTLIPTIKLEDSPKVNNEYMTLDIERTSIIKETDETYKTNLSNLINFDDEKEMLEQSDPDDCEIKTEVIEFTEESKKLPELYPVALLHGTYIVCENELGIYLIDQHAAKERVNYEKISYDLCHPNNNVIKPLIPIIIELPINEYLIVKENISILENMNIEIEEFGTSSFRVLSHPTWIPNHYEEEAIRKIIELIISKEKDFNLKDFNDSLAKMISCKMSIKANTFIDKPSMESLINDLRKCKNPFNCPHGRPSIIHFSKYDLEKMFKRSM